MQLVTSFQLVYCIMHRVYEEAVNTVFIRGNEITQKIDVCVRVRFHLEINDINSSNSRSECQWKTQ